jgi:hypothetical protein
MALPTIGSLGAPGLQLLSLIGYQTILPRFIYKVNMYHVNYALRTGVFSLAVYRFRWEWEIAFLS